MFQGLVQTLVGVGEPDVLAHHRDVDLLGPAPDALVEFFPSLHPRFPGPHVEVLDDAVIQSFAVELEGHLIDAFHIHGIDDRGLLDVAEQGDLLLEIGGEPLLGPAQEDQGLDPYLPELLDRMLGGFRFELSRCCDVGDEGEVDIEDVGPSHVEPELPDRLEEGQRLDVTHRAADLHDGDVIAGGRAPDPFLYLVSDVRYDLHGLAEVLAVALLLDHRIIDLTRGEVVLCMQDARGEALVVPEIQVGFGPVVGDEDLAVLERAHGAGIHVDVGVELDVAHLEPAGFHDGTDGCRCQAFPERRQHAAGNEDVLGRLVCGHDQHLSREYMPPG